ncbi:hypothetical protein E0485_21790 [Paenibacillus albiflavus]|uniref:Uncharacterized protein n=1 Tax=Paenibacillus albiflavus TaxID=2545760 RepID=A0A4R4E0U9_9BACL|nr:hypothetical protein [Paenibacillus albiflavus]TCZ73054.1 hypothetical protein E0485_21790 [Paenibacillus albiflavus]
MIDNSILEAIESFCCQHVSPKIKLMVPNDDDITDYQLMHPNVFIGWLPPPNQLEDVPLQLPDGVKKAIPAMVIGMDDGEDDGNDAGINIRISFIVYNPGHYPKDGGVLPDFKGYRDLLNFIFICRQQLSSRYLVEDGKTTAQKPFSWGMYQQQPMPYWVGYLTFRATAAILPFISSTDLIQD